MSIPIQSVFDRLPPKKKRKPAIANRAYCCRCGRPVFFRNSVCLACRTPLGYEPHLRQVYPLQPGPDPDTWELAIEGLSAAKYRRCANLETPAACNWLIEERDSDGATGPFCIARRLNRTIPNLSVPENGVL